MKIIFRKHYFTFFEQHNNSRSDLCYQTHLETPYNQNYSQRNQNINILKALRHAEWGAENSILINLYRSKLDYGTLYYNVTNFNILKTIDIIHNECLRVATGVFRSNPFPRILAISGEPPLQICRVKLSLYYITHILSCPENSTLKILIQNRYTSIFHSNWNLKKPLRLRIQNKMALANIDPML